MIYRREIDGLRALAVIPVILFHAGINNSEGGFVGVDVFFDISGYLITGLILSKKENANFSLIDFYERRARRILPALFVVMFFCIPPAYLLMLPNQLEDFSESLIAVSLFLSNILFWTESNYFSAAAELKPLLHTWSLAVEEQFYIFFPLFILIFWRFGKLTLFFIIFFLALMGLGLAEFFSSRSPVANFYLTPMRSWELLSGSLLAIYMQNFNFISRSNNFQLDSIGLFLIFFSILVYNSHTPFPGLYALIPIIGTLLIICFANQNTITGKFLGSKALVSIGLISYSAYLWHQPLLAFARLSSFSLLGQEFLLLICFLSFIFAYLSWRFVEQPFRDRNKKNKKQLILFLSSLLSGIIIFGYLGIHSKGFENQKYSPESINFLKNYQGKENSILEYKEDCNFYESGLEISPSCYQESLKKDNILIWGDSHAQALGPGLRYNLGNHYNFLQVATSSCLPEIEKRIYTKHLSSCKRSNAFSLKVIEEVDMSKIIFAQEKDHMQTDWEEISLFLNDYGINKIIIFGPTPRWVQPLPNLVAYHELHNQPLLNNSFIGLDAKVFKEDKILKERFASNPRVIYISIIDLLCNEDGCRFRIDNSPSNDNLTQIDQAHLSATGSKFVIQRALPQIELIHDVK